MQGWKIRSEEPDLSPDKMPEKTGDILRRVLRDLGLEGRMEEARLRAEWVDVVGQTIASRCRPGQIRGGILFIMVDSNVWMQEIRFHQDRILKRIGERFPGLKVGGIRLSIERERSEG